MLPRKRRSYCPLVCEQHRLCGPTSASRRLTRACQVSARNRYCREIPGPVVQLHASLSSPQNATVVWTAPTYEVPLVTRYSTTVAECGSSADVPGLASGPRSRRTTRVQATPAPSTSTTVANLTLGKQFKFSVTAYNELGAGPTTVSSCLVVPGEYSLMPTCCAAVALPCLNSLVAYGWQLSRRASHHTSGRLEASRRQPVAPRTSLSTRPWTSV